jgi:hypothetical protein
MSETPTLRERAENYDLWPTKYGPWLPAEDGRMFDHGQRWCFASSCHAQNTDEGRYPHSDHPATECRTHLSMFDDVREGTDGDEQFLDVYVAHPYAFGEAFADAARWGDRVVFDVAEGDEPPRRFSMPLGEALILARHLERLVDTVRAR